MDEFFSVDFELTKSVKGTDENGNYIFEVEASNENVDLQDQIVLQSALMKSKKNFIEHGVISYDHLHRRKDENGQVISDPSMIIGEPTDVWTDGKSTFVKGILYKTNAMAREIINMLKAGSTRIRASVGGLFPKTTKDEKTGVEKIVSVLWNDLALTPCPVNNSVGYASFAKSLTVSEFAKSLSAGYGTDSSTFTDGRAMQSEDVSIKDEEKKEDEVDSIDVVPEKADVKRIVKGLFAAVKDGWVVTDNDAVNFLTEKSLTSEQAQTVVHEINKYGGKVMPKFADTVDEMLKSMGANPDDEELEVEKAEDSEDEMEFDFDEEDMSDDDAESTDGKSTEKCKKSCKKSVDVDATELLKSLRDELTELREQNAEMQKSIEDIGEANVMLAEMVKSLSDEQIPFQSTMNKSVNAVAKSTIPTEKPTKADFEAAQQVLIKAVADGEITMQKSAMIETELQLAMQGKPMSQENYDFLAKHINK